MVRVTNRFVPRHQAKHKGARTGAKAGTKAKRKHYKKTVLNLRKRVPDIDQIQVDCVLPVASPHTPAPPHVSALPQRV